jgi:hypothetical protein
MIGDIALNTAIERRREIEAQIPALAAELKRLNHFIASWFEIAGIPVPPSEKRENAKRTLPRTSNPPKEEVAEAAVAILQEAGRPMKRVELLDALTNRGIILNGKKPDTVLSTMLWRSKDKVTRTLTGYVPAQPEGTAA